MDEILKRFDAAQDRDLMICKSRGVAWQKDMSQRTYPGMNAEGVNYFDHYQAFEGAPIGKAIHAGRVAMVNKYAGEECPVLDVGIGSGEFILARPNTFGTDINPKAVEWLKKNARYGERFDEYPAFTFWDVLEHVDVPNNYFKRMPDGCYLFTSLPIFTDLDKIRESKHYKPGEHFYYWTEKGFIEWMAMRRFRLLAVERFEIEAGRESILSFAFKRDLPGYHDTLNQYQQMHAKYYGASAYLYFESIAKEVMGLNPASILDFGCGRSDLAAHFWRDGARRIAKYDPAIPQFKEMPEGAFDLVLCTDVMEHIPIDDVDRILREIRAKSKNALFTISMKPARATLPDGRNAHVTLLNAGEWTRWINSVFGDVRQIKTQWDHILMLRTW